VDGVDAGSEVEEALEAEVQEAVEEPLEVAEEAVEVGLPLPAEADLSVAEKFVAAGGQKLCLAMVYALNPDWRMDACRVAKDGTDGTDRSAECENQRRPLVKFAEDVCKTVIEESLRLDLDPGMVLAVIERESSFGRAQWDRQDRRYEVQTDICKLTLPLSRIVDRQPGRREGTEDMTWVYGPSAPNPGEMARNHQPVRVVEETDDSITLNTCAAGEAGIMQTVPREFRAGTTIEATGEVLAGSSAAIRLRVEQDPVLQVRLGCQALAEHRALVSIAERSPWWMFLGTYNTGSIVRGEHWCSYTCKVMRHYSLACQDGWFSVDDTPLNIRVVQDAWLECGRVQAAYDDGWDTCGRCD
jgi:hypothetical protein